MVIRLQSGLQYQLFKEPGEVPPSGNGCTLKITMVIRRGDSVIHQAAEMPEYKKPMPGIVFPY